VKEEIMPTPIVDEVPTGEAPDPVASALVAACEAAWAEIQQHHPELPPAVIVLGTGIQGGKLVKLGHWWQSQWVADGAARGEVLLAGEALHLPADQVLEILVHEAAHGINSARGVKDTSRGGRYHNQRFKATAAEVGLKVERMNPYGWARTTLRPETVERYADAIATIGEHLRIARALPRRALTGVEGRDEDTAGIDGEGGERQTRKTPAAECGCGRKMRMAASVLAKGPVTCGLCETEFFLPRQADRVTESTIAAAPAEARFVDRRQQQLHAEGDQPDRLQQGLDFLAAFEQAMSVIAARTGDDRPLEVFRQERDGIGAWYEGVIAADVVEIGDRRGRDVDLRTVRLPSLDPPTPDLPREGLEIAGPEL
jgi:hypothetical protein